MKITFDTNIITQKVGRFSYLDQVFATVYCGNLGSRGDLGF